MRIVLVSDAWAPQVNGVVRTIQALKRELDSAGHEVVLVTPDRFFTVPCPTYAEIRLAVAPGRALEKLIAMAEPDAIHILTEGPLGIAARSLCRRRGLTFTTSFHTRFPEYVEARFGVPRSWTYSMLRRFHEPSATVMVAAESVRRELATHGFQRLSPWTRGVDLRQFRPMPKPSTDLARPIFLNVGRIAVEKNLTAFLDLDLPGTKIVVGDGPLLDALAHRYPGVRFLGRLEGDDLAAVYAMSDVFVFPSRTDTFGLVLLEALACGLPIAAYPVPGPADIVDDPRVGCLDEDLGRAALTALQCNPADCRSFVDRYSWKRSAEQFLANLVRVR